MPLNHSTCPVSTLSTVFRDLNATRIEQEIEQELSHDLAFAITTASVLLFIGLFFTFFGARLVKPTLFCAAFVSATIASFLAFDGILSQAAISANAACILLGAAPLATGLVAGVLSLCLLQLGFFMLGAGAGCGLGYTLYLAGLDRIDSPLVGNTGYDLTFVLCLSIGALLGAIVMCKCQKSLLIFATAAIGAGASTAALVLLLAHAKIVFHASCSAAPTTVHCVPSYVQPIVAVALFGLGLLVQCRSARKTREAAYEAHLRPAQVPLMRP